MLRESSKGSSSLCKLLSLNIGTCERVYCILLYWIELSWVESFDVLQSLAVLELNWIELQWCLLFLPTILCRVLLSVVDLTKILPAKNLIRSVSFHFPRRRSTGDGVLTVLRGTRTYSTVLYTVPSNICTIHTVQYRICCTNVLYVQCSAVQCSTVQYIYNCTVTVQLCTRTVTVLVVRTNKNNINHSNNNNTNTK